MAPSPSTSRTGCCRPFCKGAFVDITKHWALLAERPAPPRLAFAGRLGRRAPRARGGRAVMISFVMTLVISCCLCLTTTLGRYRTADTFHGAAVGVPCAPEPAAA